MAYALFWLCVALIVYTYVGYPLLLRLLASLIRRRPARPSETLRITLLICAHNEAASIEAKLRETLALHYPADRLQILVASDGSTDNTDAIVRSFAGRGVKLIRIPQQAGKTHAQNVAIQHAQGDIVVFSDATTRYHPDALRFLAGNYSNPRVGATSGCYVYLDPTHISPNGAGAKVYANYDNKIRSLQSQVWSITGCCGCIYSLRRSLYTPLGEDTISDLVQPLHVLRQGFRVTFEPRALAWESVTSSPRREFAMRVRVVARALSGLLSVPELLLPWYAPWIALQIWSHKLLRWAIPLFLLGLLISAAFLLRSPFYRAAFALQALLYATALLTYLFPLHRRWWALGLPLYFCTVNAAALGGLIQLLRGHRYTFWRPEREDVDASC
jgi:cellulose synthase/poly-beta-1,6-N-acetylglucosamine synthase-like glycosyltransferase